MNLPAFVQSGVDLSACNTLALPCRAAYYARLETRAQLAELAGVGLPAGCRRLVLGGGSNLVLPSEFDGLVVHMAITDLLHCLNRPPAIMASEHFRSAWRIDMDTSKMKHFLLMGIVLIGSVFVVLMNLVADVIYAVADPRIRY